MASAVIIGVALPSLKLVGWVLLLLVLSAAAITAMFVRNLRRVWRGEPIRSPFVGSIYPGDPAYGLALLKRFALYMILFMVLIFVGSLAIFLFLHPLVR